MLGTTDCFFVSRLTGRNEYDLVKLKGVGSFACCHQVAVVNWVEGATHHANS
jgi:hypothetical protein